MTAGDDAVGEGRIDARQVGQHRRRHAVDVDESAVTVVSSKVRAPDVGLDRETRVACGELARSAAQPALPAGEGSRVSSARPSDGKPRVTAVPPTKHSMIN